LVGLILPPSLLVRVPLIAASPTLGSIDLTEQAALGILTR
jgi:hypothetical protein